MLYDVRFEKDAKIYIINNIIWNVLPVTLQQQNRKERINYNEWISKKLLSIYIYLYVKFRKKEETLYPFLIGEHRIDFEIFISMKLIRIEKSILFYSSGNYSFRKINTYECRQEDKRKESKTKLFELILKKY